MVRQAQESELRLQIHWLPSQNLKDFQSERKALERGEGKLLGEVASWVSWLETDKRASASPSVERRTTSLSFLQGYRCSEYTSVVTGPDHRAT